jgi:hypothetical protein
LNAFTEEKVLDTGVVIRCVLAVAVEVRFVRRQLNHVLDAPVRWERLYHMRRPQQMERQLPETPQLSPIGLVGCVCAQRGFFGVGVFGQSTAVQTDDGVVVLFH